MKLSLYIRQWDNSESSKFIERLPDNMTAVLLLAMHRARCTNPNETSSKQLWKQVYRQFRQEARDLYHVEQQLIKFRGKI